MHWQLHKTSLTHDFLYEIMMTVVVMIHTDSVQCRSFLLFHSQKQRACYNEKKKKNVHKHPFAVKQLLSQRQELQRHDFQKLQTLQCTHKQKKKKTAANNGMPLNTLLWNSTSIFYNAHKNFLRKKREALHQENNTKICKVFNLPYQGSFASLLWHFRSIQTLLRFLPHHVMLDEKIVNTVTIHFIAVYFSGWQQKLDHVQCGKHIESNHANNDTL